jgi:hypothetical protein
MKGAEDAERLGDLQRAVVRQHDAAAADPDPVRGGGDLGDQDLRRRAREHRRAVVLGHPVAGVAEPLRQPRQVDRVPQRIGSARALGDRRLVEDAEQHHVSLPTPADP